MCVESPHSLAAGGKVRMVANPVKFSETPILDYKAPPMQGEHTDSVLREILGMDAAEIHALREKGVI
ncbi:formyl-coenzyme A transferase [compost metagenome]